MTMQRMAIQSLPMLIMLLWAAAGDLRSRRISNALTFSLVLSGFLQSVMPMHLTTPGQAMLGFLVGFGLPFVLFAIGALGGGDVKLLAGIGAWIGPGPVVAVFIIEAVVGMVIVLGQAVYQRRTTMLLRNSALVMVNMLHLGEVGVEHVRETGRACRSVDRPLPYAVPVLIAVLIVMGLQWR